jgi:CheY-like chemotaxis protein
MKEPLSILVVDDNPSITRTLADILEVLGYEVHVANSGIEALGILRNQHVELLLTDVKMPGMNGVELFLETKKTHPHLTTFIMTAYAADDLIMQGKTAGIKTVLTKPVDIESLLKLINTTVRISK